MNPLLQQNGPSPARNAVFVALLVVSLVAVTVYGREGSTGPLHSVQHIFSVASAQVNSVGAGIGSAAESAGEGIADATASDSTLSALREQNEQLRQMLSNAEEYQKEAERLQGLLDMKQASGVTGPVAHIIGRSANAWDQSITIDLGSDDGVQSGMTILGSTGVIGQVSSTTAKTSTVRLLTDANSGAAVMIQSSRKTGIVRGSITGVLYLEDLDEGVIPEVGDVIVTSGLGGSYQRGLIVGAVVSVNKTASNSTGSIVVSPNDSAALLEEVIVVFSASDIDAVEKQAAEEAARAQPEAEGESEEAGYEDEERSYEEGGE